MGIYRKIVLAVDGSEASKNAVRHAIRLAKQNSATLIIVHVVSLSDIMNIEVLKPESLLKGLRQEGERILSEVNGLAEKEGVDVQTVIEEGIPFEKICEVAQNAGADLIVMGSHGHTGIGRVFIGSVTERVISKVQGRPVLVVK